jgi:hypothetical protein
LWGVMRRRKGDDHTLCTEIDPGGAAGRHADLRHPGQPVGTGRTRPRRCAPPRMGCRRRFNRPHRGSAIPPSERCRSNIDG